MLVDRRQYVGTGLAGFEGSAMTKAQFKDAMRSQFHLKLSKAELDVLFNHFDHDQGGTVEYMEVRIESLKDHNTKNVISD
jgi:Ca2+-binding EF-hand superfamily protein